ncbi:MAG: DUF2341 domain-containing protein [Kiritimatiellae bacterium]|nr:DUF2341 domain-containing protein [Kiritimatiellia bacterium]
MKRILATLLLLPFAASAAPSKTAWATVAGYAGTTTLQNFPVLVKISESAVPGFHYSDCAAGGADLSFADAAGNALPFDVDTWNASGTSLVWVLLPEVAPGGATTFKMGWSDPSPAAANAAAVWTGSGHKGVWHMNAASPADASGSGNGGTAAGGATTAAGKIGSALSLPTTSDYVTCGQNQSNAELADAFTVEAWVNPAGYGGNRCIFGKKQFISFRTEGQSQITVTTPGKTDHKLTGLSLPDAGIWRHVALTFQKGATNGCKVYVNGSLIAQMNAGDITDTTTATEMWFGKNEWGQNYTGLLDEIRLAPGIRSADWIAAEHAQAEDGFVEFGSSGTASTVFFY